MMEGVPAVELPRALLAGWVSEARARTLALIDDLSDPQLEVPRSPLLNPFRWELGHVAWFQERFALRLGAGREPLREDGDRLFDSVRVAHETRWDLQLPGRAATRAYAERVRDEVLALLEREPAPQQAYLIALGVMHEDMHGEAFTYMCHALEVPSPPAAGGATEPRDEPLAAGDAEFGATTIRMGSEPGAGFVFDNEKLPHDVAVGPFALARAPVTEAEFENSFKYSDAEIDALLERAGLAREAWWLDPDERFRLVLARTGR